MKILPIIPNLNQSLQYNSYTIRISIGTNGQVFLDALDNAGNIALNTFIPVCNVPIKLGTDTLFIFDTTGANDTPTALGIGERWLLIYA